MVHLVEKKIIIEMDVQNPEEDWKALSASLLSLLACLDGDLAVYDDIQNVLLLAKALGTKHQ